MKTSHFIMILVSSLLIVLVLVIPNVLIPAVSGAPLEYKKNPTPTPTNTLIQTVSIQLITQEFPTTQDLPEDGVTYVTLLQIPFTIENSGLVQVTNLMSFNVNGGYGIRAELTCNLEMDGTQFVSKSYDTNAGSSDTDGSVTSTQAVGSGSHVISLACTSYTWGGTQTDTPLTVNSHGTSLIIVDK